jgi:hypothetical protein
MSIFRRSVPAASRLRGRGLSYHLKFPEIEFAKNVMNSRKATLGLSGVLERLRLLDEAEAAGTALVTD